MNVKINIKKNVSVKTIEELEEQRKRLGLSLKDVSRLCGIPHRTLQNYVYHVSKLNPLKALQIESALLSADFENGAKIETYLSKCENSEIFAINRAVNSEIEKRIHDIGELISEVNT